MTEIHTPPIPFATWRKNRSNKYKPPIIHWTTKPWMTTVIPTMCGLEIDRRVHTPSTPEDARHFDTCSNCQKAVGAFRRLEREAEAMST